MSVKSFWENASPTAKRVVMASAALSVFLIFGSFVALMDRSNSRPKPVKTLSETTVMMPQRKNTDMEGLAASSTALTRRVQQVETDRKTDMAGVTEQLKQIRELVSGNDSTTREMADLKAKLESVTKRLEETQAQPKPLPAPVTPPPAKLPPLNAVIPRSGSEPEVPAKVPEAEWASSAPMKPTAPERKLRVIGAGEGGDASGKGSQAGGGESGKVVGEASAPKRAAESETVYLPMGSMVQGVLLNGLDAPTSGAAQKNPTPVLIRIKHDAILPNRARMDIKECFVIASGFGSMATERANLRTEGISCVREDGGVIETNLNGYVIGEDGKVGMRGRLVSKQGAMIAKSLASGFLSGLGKALTPTGVVGLNLAPSGTIQTQNPDLGTAFEAGVLGGASNSLNQISRFYLDIAKEMVPVVEVDAGRPVTIVLTRGGSLRLSSK
jgi:conjugal transfer pilus assembly protein TraB